MVSLEALAILLSGISISVSIIYYASVLRNQQKSQRHAEETRQAQFFMNLYKEIQQEEGEARLHFVNNIDYTDFDDFMKKYSRENNLEAWSKITSFVSFLEGIGVLVSEGYVDISLVARLLSGDIMISWSKLQPWIYASRERYDWPRFGIETEYLYNSVVEYAAKHPELEIKLPDYKP